VRLRAAPVREREVVLRLAAVARFGVLRLAVLALAVLRFGFAAPALERELPFFALRVADVDRVARAPADFARLPVLRVPVERDAAERLALVLRRALPREVVERFVDEPEVEDALASPSIVHLPDITRCAASATASAMIEPSLVALDMTLVAACEAESAASSPASRILRRAAGLALIAAAAAARPAASISLLIAALASLSIASLDRDEEPEELLLEDLAIA
jgi:hypothetical protein